MSGPTLTPTSSPSPSAASPPPPHALTPEDADKFLFYAGQFAAQGPDLLKWADAFRLENDAALDFDAFPFQRELYEAFGDRTQRTVDVMKSGQCGISAAAVSLALYAGDVWGANVLYVLPTEDMAYTFSDTRVKTSIEDSMYLRSLVSSTDTKGLKRIRQANIYFSGSVSERKALSIPADLLVLDEYDRLDQRNIPKFRKRLGSPKSLKLERRFSNPSFPESGIHGLYLDTDQREWFVRCSCGHEAKLNYDEADGDHFVDEDRAARVCGRCHRALSPATVAAGRWVPARPRAERRGYHISKLIVPAEDIGALVIEHHKTDEDSVTAHVNFDLGLPYSPKGGSLSREQVHACRREWVCPDGYDGAKWVTSGVDVGSVLHVRVSTYLDNGKALPMFIGTVDDFTELGQLWARYNVNFGVIDERPEERAARSFVEAHRGRALLTRWSGDEQRDPIVIDEDRRLLVARRTAACDRLVSAIGEQRRLLPKNLPVEYVSQVTAPHRVVETNSRGQKIARYVNERADHFFFCELYDLLAREARGGPAEGAWGPPPKSIRESIGRF